MIPNSFTSRFKRFWRTLSASQKKGVTGGSVLLFLGLLAFGRSNEPETHTIIERVRSTDFKGAEILGNPRQIILQGEESLFSKTKKSVLDSEMELKTQVAALKLEVDELRSKNGDNQTSPAPSVSSVTVSPLPSFAVSGKMFGPPSPTGTPDPTPNGQVVTWSSPAPGVEKAGKQDKIRVTQAQTKAKQTDGQTTAIPSDGFGLGVKGGKAKLGSNLVSFPVKSTGRAFLKKPGIILPSGSYVKAMLLTGVEAPEGKSYPVLLQLDYAYVIPNDKRLDLAGCFMIAKAQGDLSTERVQMQATKLSCVSKKGGMFEREVNGFIADDADNSFAVVGRVNSKQDRVAATAFLSSIVAGIGKAIQQAQTTSQVTPLGGSQTVLTGDQGKFIAAGGASDAASQVTQWYLKQAQNLLPTINVGSGQGVWVIMQDQVDLPKDYFNQTQSQEGGSQNASIYSYFTRLID